MTKKNKVLIIEDEPIVSADIEISLEEEGYIIIGICASAEEAIKKLQEERPDLIILDINLAGNIDGIDFALKVGSRIKVPIIYITGSVDKQTLTRVKETFPVGYLSKPYKEADLMAAVYLALNKNSPS